uniref:Type II toxin-antitoxin system VapC family toxin n=1 Tax=Ignisphaera aggregans TaxID=334771 RepID=A0A7J2U193_9CREN
MKLLPDTNILIYDTVEDSEYHSIASEIIDKAIQIFTPSIVIHEYLWVMLRLLQAPLNIIEIKLREYLEDPRTVYILESIDVLVNALKMLTEDKQDVKEINDYIILSTAQKYNLMLATFDKKLRKIAINRNLKVVP